MISNTLKNEIQETPKLIETDLSRELEKSLPGVRGKPERSLSGTRQPARTISPGSSVATFAEHLPNIYQNANINSDHYLPHFSHSGPRRVRVGSASGGHVWTALNDLSREFADCSEQSLPGVANDLSRELQTSLRAVTVVSCISFFRVPGLEDIQ